jgi:hypothetical protein
MIYRIIGKLLHDSPAIRDRVASRIHFENAPAQDPRNPTQTMGECIIIRHVSSAVNDHLQNESDCAQPTVQIDFYAESVSKAHSGYQAIRNLLSGYRGEATYLDDDGTEATTEIHGCNLIRPGALIEEPRDSSDKWRYRYSADFEVFHSQDVPTHV